MLLNSIFLLLIVFSSDVYIVSGALLGFGIIIYLKNKNIVLPEKRYYLPLLITAAIVQILYNRDGKIFLGNSFFGITYSGITAGILSGIKIFGMIFISKNSDFKQFLKGRLKKQGLIFDIVVKIVPEILKMPKNILNPGKTLKFILKRVYRELNKLED